MKLSNSDRAGFYNSDDPSLNIPNPIGLNNPDYYKIHGVDTMDAIIDVVEMNARHISEAIYLFNVLKYLIRYPRKNGKEDLLKAKDYLERLILNYDKEVDNDTKRVFKSGHSTRPEN